RLLRACGKSPLPTRLRPTGYGGAGPPPTCPPKPEGRRRERGGGMERSKRGGKRGEEGQAHRSRASPASPWAGRPPRVARCGAVDVLAWLAAGLAALWLARVEKIAFPAVTTDLPYIAAILLGAGLGAYAFGTANLWLSGMPGVARSIEGAVAGGILAVELYKR